MEVLTPDQAKLEEGRRKFSNFKVYDDGERTPNLSVADEQHLTQTLSVLDGN